MPWTRIAALPTWVFGDARWCGAFIEIDASTGDPPIHGCWRGFAEASVKVLPVAQLHRHLQVHRKLLEGP